MACGIPHLKKRAEFVQVARSGRSFATPGLVLQVLQRGSQLVTPASAVPLRLGITTSRKVGTAVARNRARRRLRALAAQILSVHGAKGYDYVLIGRPETVTRPFPQLVADLTLALRRLKVWRGADDPQPARPDDGRCDR